jgi:hypothetical protein
MFVIEGEFSSFAAFTITIENNGNTFLPHGVQSIVIYFLTQVRM